MTDRIEYWDSRFEPATEFVEVLVSLMLGTKTDQIYIAGTGLMHQRYVSKLLTAYVAPTPRTVNLLLGVMGATAEQRARLHLAGARTVGWEV